MLFHTWPFFIFLMIVLPGFFALRRTRLWLPWLTLASYFFYGWWNPYYLLLVMYSTLLDFSLVALMDHCPVEGGTGGRESALDAIGVWRPGAEICVSGIHLRRLGNPRPGRSGAQDASPGDGGPWACSSF